MSALNCPISSGVSGRSLTMGLISIPNGLLSTISALRGLCTLTTPGKAARASSRSAIFLSVPGEKTSAPSMAIKKRVWEPNSSDTASRSCKTGSSLGIIASILASKVMRGKKVRDTAVRTRTAAMTAQGRSRTISIHRFNYSTSLSLNTTFRAPKDFT